MVHYISTSALCTAATSSTSTSLSTSTLTSTSIHNGVVNVDNNNISHNNAVDDKIMNFGQLIKMANSMGDIRNCPVCSTFFFFFLIYDLN